MVLRNMPNLSVDDIAGLAELEREMDSGKQPFVVYGGKRLAFPANILWDFRIETGQRISGLIVMELMKSMLLNMKHDREQTKVDPMVISQEERDMGAQIGSAEEKPLLASITEQIAAIEEAFKMLYDSLEPVLKDSDPSCDSEPSQEAGPASPLVIREREIANRLNKLCDSVTAVAQRVQIY